MTKLPDDFIADRALRDAARAVLSGDVARLRSSLAEQGIASRVSSGVTERVRSGANDALGQARDHAAIIAVLVGAIVLWFARGPIAGWLGAADDEDGAQGSDDADQIDDTKSGDSA